MQNLFKPSETIACIEQKYIGKTYKIRGKVYTEPFTKEKIRSLFRIYVDAIGNVFGGRAIVMQKTRALKNGTIVPITSYEYVYKNNQSIVEYTNEGYYAVTLNGYRMCDIMDSAYHYFTDGLTGGGRIIENLASILDIDKDAVKKVLVGFFCGNSFESFDAFLRHIMLTGSVDIYTFDVCASVTCAFGEPLPIIGSCTEIQTMNRRAQNEGLAVDECDLDGWKMHESNTRNERNVCDFFDRALECSNNYSNELPCDSDTDQSDEEEVEDNLAEIREDIDNDNEKTKIKVNETDESDVPVEPDESEESDDSDEFNVPEESDESDDSDESDEDAHGSDEDEEGTDPEEDPMGMPTKRSDEDEEVFLSSASDGNHYTYSVTWLDKDGKPQSKTFYGEAAKKMMSKGDHMNEKSKEKCDKEPTLGDTLRFFDKRLAKLEMDMSNLQRPVRVRREHDLFDLFDGFRDLFDGF